MWRFDSPAELGEQRYQVQLEIYSGPLELLLHLIERRELDITAVSLASVTDQFIKYVQAMAEPNPEHLADFLVVAAKLLAIKAMTLLSRPPDPVEEEDDAGDLVAALREYQLFQRAAGQLKAWADEDRREYSRDVPVAPIPIAGPNGLQLGDLVGALRRVLASVGPAPEVTAEERPRYTVKEKIAFVLAALVDAPAVTFRQLIPSPTNTLEVVITFLALLDLLKERLVVVEQGMVFGEIVITLSEQALGDRRRSDQDKAPATVGSS